MVRRFQDAWESLHVEYDDFIRTTQDRHVRVVTAVLQDLWDKGEIYLGDYEGWYCVPDERFWTEKDVEDKTCPDCGRPVELVSEQDYFFRMGKHQDWLVDYIEAHPDFILPENRRNEVLSYLRKPLGDLCISRPRERMGWGIPLPFDQDYVTYVWFDALLNYVTAAGYLSDGRRFSQLWPQAVHLIGKDILITHAVYWPVMLRAAGLPPPGTIYAHGWWLVRGEKMSKSLGNVSKPLDFGRVYGADAVRFYLMRGMSAGRDADFNAEDLDAVYKAALADDLDNLLHRLVNMIVRYCDGMTPSPGRVLADEDALRHRCEELVSETLERVAAFEISLALRDIGDVVRDVNRYVEHRAPWTAARDGRADDAGTVLYHAAEALRVISVLLWPVMPERMTELWRRLGWRRPGELPKGLSWGGLSPSTAVSLGPPLFPKDIGQK